jgi:polyphosphate kinase 2 (PPK2 family)
MKINSIDFIAPKGVEINLEKWPTRVKPTYKSKKDYKKQLYKQVNELSEQQKIHYASHQHSVLIVFQAMDAAGKDSAIKHVMSGINPQGCQVFNFKVPSEMDLEHDFLWRTYQCLPERGRIGIFNRSYYEGVLIEKVHPENIFNQRHNI